MFPMPSAHELDHLPPASVSFWRDIGHALRGRPCDYTREQPHRAVLLLAVPMVLETFMESLFAIVSIFWVSRLGRDAIAIVGLTESVMTVIYAICTGTAIAATAIISRRIGEKDNARAAQTAAQILVLTLIASSVLGLGLGYFAIDVLRLMGASESAIDLGANYARLMFGANATVFFIFVINAIFRGAGDAVLAMRTLWLANAINILLAPCFIFGWGPFPECGLTGAAVATNIGRGIGVLYQLWHLAGPRTQVRLKRDDFVPRPAILQQVLRTSLTGIAQLLIATTSWIALFKILATFGSAAVAGYTITVRIALFVLMPSWGLAGAAATLVGQNLGAKQPERADVAVRIATRLNVVLLAMVGVLFFIFAEPLVRLFTSDSEVVAHAVQALRIMSVALPLFGAGMCLASAFNGAGDIWTPTRTSFYCLWLGAIPLALLLSEVLRLGALGVFISVPAASSTLAIWNYVLFASGKWKLQTL
jgi:putative MATE family efflux protein